MLYNQKWDIQQRLDRIADYIEEKGWCQNAWNDGAAVCLVTGMNHFIFDEAEWFIVWDLLRDRIALGPDGYAALTEWNDAPGRTKQDVLNLLRNIP